MSVKLSLLDFDYTFERALDALPLAEGLGFYRYWFGDHAPQPSPELLVSLAAGLTSTIRVGTGGVALGLHNELQTALNFSFLGQVHGQRIDAGVCGGWATPQVARALVGHNDSNVFETKVREWLREVYDQHESTSSPLPELWLLGGGARSALLAAELGVGYAYSIFHTNSKHDGNAIGLYRDKFRASRSLSMPRVILALSGACCLSESGVPATVTPSSVITTFCGPVSEFRMFVERARGTYLVDEFIILEQSPTRQAMGDSLRAFAAAAGISRQGVDCALAGSEKDVAKEE